MITARRLVPTLAVATLAGVFACAEPDGFTPKATTSLRLSDSLPAAVVVAQRPTVSDVLDLILKERPTAAQLVGQVTDGTFPAGSDEAHIASVLSGHSTDVNRVNRISAALVKESRKRKIGSTLLVGVLLTENPWLDPRATSFVGARGLMQVMPFHAGKWGCGTNDLFDIESNICHGVAVLADNLSRSRSLPQALLGYNGCVRGTNTPDCWRYPSKVYRQAKKGVAEGGTTQPFSSIATKRRGRATGSS